MRTSDLTFNLNANEIIHQVTYLCKYKKNYNLAAKIFLENNLSIELLDQKTTELSELDILKLTQSIMKNKNHKR